MTYNKEYIEQLLQRFMDGETTEQEEEYLAEYFSMCDSVPEEWEAYREMFASFTTDAYDFTEEEIAEFVKEKTPKPRIVKMWPWLAAACVVALLIVFLQQVPQMPPQQAPQPPKGEFSFALVAEDSVKQDKQKTKEEQPLIANIEHKAQGKVKKKIPVSKNEEPLLTETECETIPDEPTTIEDDLMAEQTPQFQEMEMAFLSHSAPIRERGEQVIRRVSMLQQQQRSQQQLVEL